MTHSEERSEQIGEQADPFVTMVTATAETNLKLIDYHPVSMLKSAVHEPLKALVPAIDFHNHLDSTDPRHVLAIMDTCGIECVVNITMRVGDEAFKIMDKFAMAASGRFATIGWMDWSDLHHSEFVQRSLDRLDRLVEHGAIGIKF